MPATVLCHSHVPVTGTVWLSSKLLGLCLSALISSLTTQACGESETFPVQLLPALTETLTCEPNFILFKSTKIPNFYLFRLTLQSFDSSPFCNLHCKSNRIVSHLKANQKYHKAIGAQIRAFKPAMEPLVEPGSKQPSKHYRLQNTQAAPVIKSNI